MNTAVGWSLGQRALLRFLHREGVLAEAPSAPTDGPATNGELFAHLAATIDQSGLVSLVADSLRVPPVDLDAEALMQDLISLLTPELAAACEMIPVAQVDDTLEVAAANPLDVDALKTIEFTTGLRVRARVATRASVLRALATWYGIVNEEPAAEPADAGSMDAPVAAAPAGDAGFAPATVRIEAEPRALPVAVADVGDLPAASDLEAEEVPAPGSERETPEAKACPPEAPVVRWTGPAGVIVVSADLTVRCRTRAVLVAGALEIVVMTVRDAAEARAVAAAGRVDVLVVDATGEAIDEPAWQRLAADVDAALVVLTDSRPAEPAAVVPDRVPPTLGLDALVAGVRRILIDQRGDPT
jgi:hypothetical protein